MKDTTEHTIETSNRTSLKTKLIIFIMVLWIITSVAFYIFYTMTKQLRVDQQKYVEVEKILTTEKERCSNLLSQESGVFGDYEYCRRLLQIFP